VNQLYESKKKQGFAEKYPGTFHLRLLTLCRPSRQALMIAADVISYVVSAVISFWIVYGITEFSSPLLAIAVAAVLVAIFGALGIWTVRLDRVLNGVDSDCGGTEIHVCRHRHRHQQWSSGLCLRFQKQIPQAALYLSTVCKEMVYRNFPGYSPEQLLERMIELSLYTEENRK
jgi:hypothetical protein